MRKRIAQINKSGVNAPQSGELLAFAFFLLNKKTDTPLRASVFSLVVENHLPGGFIDTTKKAFRSIRLPARKLDEISFSWKAAMSHHLWRYYHNPSCLSFCV